MTTPTTAKNNTPAKAAPVKPKTENTETKVSENVTETAPVVNESNKETPKVRIPENLSDNTILAEFCQRYLGIHDEIAKYNADVLAEKSSDWTAVKVLEKARAFASPDNKDDAKPEIKKALDDWERLLTEVSKARKNVLDLTSKELGITLSATAERNPEIEAPLKEKRKIAVEIGNQLTAIAGMTQDEKAGLAVKEFLDSNPLPAIGRDQVRTFGEDGTKTTPKYRVTVEVSKDGNVLLKEDGFTKTALALPNSKFGYERGKAPKADTLREVWEKAGNSATNTVSPVEFDDNGLHFVITKK